MEENPSSPKHNVHTTSGDRNRHAHAVRDPIDRSAEAPPEWHGPPIRVLFVNDHLGYAGGVIHGVTRYLSTVLPSFDPREVEPILCIVGAWHPEAEHLSALGISPLFLDRKKWDPRALIDLISVIRRNKIPVVHLSGVKASLLGRLAGAVTDCRSVIHVHDAIPLTPIMRFLHRLVSRWTDVALANSEPVRDHAIRQFSLPSHKVRVLLYGIKLEEFANPPRGSRERIRRELHLPKDIPTIGVLGRVSHVKGHSVLMRALALLLDRGRNVVLVVVGDGPERANCERLARQLGIEHAVRFMGHRSDIPAVLAAIDVVAMPSLWVEGFGLAALEAIAAGRPVVASRVGGIPLTVIDGETGFLVPRGNVEDLADAIARILDDPELAARLASGARRHARAFSIESHTERLVALYRDLIVPWS